MSDLLVQPLDLKSEVQECKSTCSVSGLSQKLSK